MEIYIDDGIVVGSNRKKIKQLVQQLKEEMIKKKNPKTYLGMEFKKSKERLKLSQTKYTKQIL